MQALQKMILVTAFEPFGDDALNPTEMLLERLPERLGGCEIRTLLLPVEFVRARERAFAAYDELRPGAVVMLGQAGGRSAITPESTGKNVMHARIPDNAGSMPEHLPIVKNGPETLRATLPIGKIVEDVSGLGIPCEQSDDAGEYVCNCLLYGMLDHNKGAVPTGFIHVPFLPEQGHTGKPFMCLSDMERGIRAAIEAVASEISR